MRVYVFVLACEIEQANHVRLENIYVFAKFVKDDAVVHEPGIKYWHGKKIKSYTLLGKLIKYWHGKKIKSYTLLGKLNCLNDKKLHIVK